MDNPLEELRMLTGEAKAWKELCGEHMARLERLRYSTAGGEQIRGEIQLFERALDRCANILVAIAKLNLDERLVRISEHQVNQLTQGLLYALGKAGVQGGSKTAILLDFARYLQPSMN